MPSDTIEEYEVEYGDNWKIHANLEEYTGYKDYDYDLYLNARHKVHGLIESRKTPFKKQEKNQGLLMKALGKEVEEPPTPQEQVEKQIREFKEWIDNEGGQKVKELEQEKEEVQDEVENAFTALFPDSNPDKKNKRHRPAYHASVTSWEDEEKMREEISQDKEQEDEDRKHRIMIDNREEGKQVRSIIPYHNLPYMKTEEMREHEDVKLMAVDFDNFKFGIDVMSTMEEPPEKNNIFRFIKNYWQRVDELNEGDKTIDKVIENLEQDFEDFKQHVRQHYQEEQDEEEE